MRKILRIARREFITAVRSKGFIIGIVIAPLFMSGSLIAFLLLKDNVDTTDKHLAVIDHSGVLIEYLEKTFKERNRAEVIDEETGKKVKPAYILHPIAPDEDTPDAMRFTLSNDVRSGKYHAFLEIGSAVVHPMTNPENARIRYFAKNAAVDDLRGWLNYPINNRLRELRAIAAGISESDIQDLFHWENIRPMGLVTIDAETGNITDARQSNEVEALIVPIILMMLMFLMIMMNSQGFLHTVMEEKTQRIAEVLLGSAKPFQIMAGKLLGGVGTSLTMSVVYFAAGTIAVNIMDFEHFFPYHVIPWFITFVILAVTLFGAISAALGSTCSEPKDAQSLTFPAMLLAMVPMFVYFPVVKEPMSSLSTIMSLIPPFTPTLMLLRMTTPAGIPAWQPWAGLIGIILFTILVVWLAGRIFRVAIMMQGTPPKLKTILRWAVKG